MDAEVYYVSERCGPPFRRWVVASTQNRFWNCLTKTWHEDAKDASLYASKTEAALECAALQRQDLGKPELLWARLPVQIEVRSDKPVEYEALKAWLMEKLSMSLDISTGTGPTPDAFVFLSIDFGKFQIF